MSVKEVIEKWKEDPKAKLIRLTLVQYVSFITTIHEGKKLVNIIFNQGLLYYHFTMTSLEKAVLIGENDDFPNIRDTDYRQLSTAGYWEARNKPCYVGTWIEVTNNGVMHELPHLADNHNFLVILSSQLGDWHKEHIRAVDSMAFVTTLDAKISNHYNAFLGLRKHRDWCTFNTDPLSLTIKVDDTFRSWILENPKLTFAGRLHPGLYSGLPFFPDSQLCAEDLDAMSEELFRLRGLFKNRKSRWFKPVDNKSDCWSIKLEADATFVKWLKENLKDEVWSTEPCMLRSAALKDLINGGRGWSFITEKMMWEALPLLDSQMDKLLTAFQTVHFKWCSIDSIASTLQPQIEDKQFLIWLKDHAADFTILYNNWGQYFTFTDIADKNTWSIPQPRLVHTAERFNEKIDTLYKEFKREPLVKITYCKLSALEVDIPARFLEFINRSVFFGTIFRWFDKAVSGTVSDGENGVWSAVPKPRLGARFTVSAYGPPELILTLNKGLDGAWNAWRLANPDAIDFNREAVTEQEPGVTGVKIERLGQPASYSRDCNLQEVFEELLLTEPDSEHPRIMVV